MELKPITVKLKVDDSELKAIKPVLSIRDIEVLVNTGIWHNQKAEAYVKAMYAMPETVKGESADCKHEWVDLSRNTHSSKLEWFCTKCNAKSTAPWPKGE